MCQSPPRPQKNALKLQMSNTTSTALLLRRVPDSLRRNIGIGQPIRKAAAITGQKVRNPAQRPGERQPSNCRGGHAADSWRRSCRTGVLSSAINSRFTGKRRMATAPPLSAPAHACARSHGHARSGRHSDVCQPTIGARLRATLNPASGSGRRVDPRCAGAASDQTVWPRGLTTGSRRHRRRSGRTGCRTRQAPGGRCPVGSRPCSQPDRCASPLRIC